ncbi:MAG: hypothetical protein JWN56_531 [Sphingobacteriales bacterium]|nr:hypothetical protein [Sphingobacteriales bacterium]
MSKVVYICFKDSSRCNVEIEDKIETIAKRITPDNIIANPTKIVRNGNTVYGVINPVDSVLENGSSVLLGMAFGDHDKWWEPQQRIPDGCYSIFRSNTEKTELITDVTGSRSIWYYHDSEVLIASSSQRAIIMMLGSFQLNSDVFPWILSTGSLGPGLSWDSRIKILPADSIGTLDHERWSLVVNTNEVEFKAADFSGEEHEGRLKSSLTETFSSLNVDFNKWILPLSGGYDSRGILSLFHSFGAGFSNIKAVTWGIKDALKKPGNDASVAKKLADHYRIKHNYYLTDLSDEPIEKIFNRFLVCGEGRIDHIGGYLDGFKIWKTLFENKVCGVIRGDEGFGKESVSSAAELRWLIGISLCTDFSNLQNPEALGIQGNQLPNKLQRRENETLETWRDRMYHSFRMPYILPAFNDLKLSYVEVINPLLSRKIVYQARTLPDHLRSNKVLFKKIVNSINPNIEYATSGATAETRYLLQSQSAVDLFTSTLSSTTSEEVLPKKLTDYVLKNVIVKNGNINKSSIIKSVLKRYLPAWVRTKATRMNLGKPANMNVLAFRCYIINRMNETLKEDATIFQKVLV